MKKRIPLIICLLICLVILAGCGCKHTWVEADCITAKTCSDCGKTEGEPLGHSWADAACEAPKTCSICAATEGDAPGHSWADATCEAPKTCTVCAAAEGEPLAHIFEISEYTVTDDIPVQTSTCNICGLQETREGEALVSHILTSGVWSFLTARFYGEEIDIGERSYIIFDDENGFTFFLSDDLKLTGTWEFYESYEKEDTVTHSLLFSWQDGGTMNALQYTDPDTSWEVFIIRDSDKNYLSFFKIDYSELF